MVTKISNTDSTISTQIERENLIKVFRLVEKLSGNKIKIKGPDQKIPLLYPRIAACIN